MTYPPLLFCDLEACGLPIDHPDGTTSYPLLLEAALLLTDSDLNTVATTTVVIRYPRWQVMDGITPEVLAMHEASGLFAEVEHGVSIDEAEQRLLAFVEEHQAKGLYMAGSGIGYERRMLPYHMPTLAKVWHYRNVDLTTLRYFFGTPKAEVKHRALADCEQALNDLRAYVQRARTAGLLPLPAPV